MKDGTIILNINNEKTKEILKNKFYEFDIENIFNSIKIEPIEYSLKNREIKVKVNIKTGVGPEFFIKLKNYLEEQTEQKIFFSFKFDKNIPDEFLINNFWIFFIEYLSKKCAWIEDSEVEYKNGILIFYAPNEFIYKKLINDEIKKILKNSLNEFFFRDIRFDIKTREKDVKNKQFDFNKAKINIVVNENNIKSDVLKKEEINGKVTPISDIIKEGKYIIEGNVFTCEEYIRETKNKEKYVLIFYLTDKKDTLKLITFVEKDDGLIKEIEKLENVRALVDVKYDEIEGELVGTVKKMQRINKEKRQDKNSNKRIELHAHTSMSAMDSVMQVEDYLETAKFWGHKAVAITDHGVVHAFPKAFKLADKIGIKVIFGMEGYVVNSEENFKNENYFHIILLVKNQVGLKNLYKLVSKSHINYFYKKPRLPKKIIQENRDGLILGTACYLGELYQAILNKLDEEKIKDIVKFYDFFEIQPIANNKFLIKQNKVNSIDELKEINKKIYDIGKKYGKPVVATGDVHFLEETDKIFRQVLMAGQGYEDVEDDDSADIYFRTTDEMLEEFSYLGKEIAREVVIDNTYIINDMIEEAIKPVPDKINPPNIKKAEEEITDLTWKRAQEIYGKNLDPVIKKRIEIELEAIVNNNFSSLYSIAKKMIDKSLEKGFIVGSRGSVGSSLVAFLCGISEVNPLPAHYLCNSCKYVEFVLNDSSIIGLDLEQKKCPKCGTLLIRDGFNIPFESFVGFKRNKPPDIDLNFAGEIQTEIHDFLRNLFGSDKVYRVGTISTLQKRAIKKDFIEKFIEKTGRTLRKAEIERLAIGCSNVKRSTGQHAGGLILVPEDKEIYDFSPIQFSPTKDVITTHFEYDWLEKSLVKIDALGHDLPSSLNRLGKELNIKIDDIPLDDKKVLQMFRDIKVLGLNPDDYEYPVGTLGIPEYGTKLVRKVLTSSKPKNFSELIYVAGLTHGQNVWENNAEILIKEKKLTLKEVISVRDDIMNYLISKNIPSDKAYEITERVRKKELTITAEDVKIMKEYKVPEWYIESCRKISYMFPKAHAAAYAMMSVRIAFFKMYHPLYFYADYFTRQMDGFDYEFAFLTKKEIKSKIMELTVKKQRTQKEEKNLEILEVIYEMKDRGFEFLNVDLYESAPTTFKVKDEKIMLPLIAVPSLGEKVAKVVEEQRQTKFSSLEDIKRRTKINKNIAQFFKEKNIIKDIPDTEQIVLF